MKTIRELFISLLFIGFIAIFFLQSCDPNEDVESNESLKGTIKGLVLDSETKTELSAVEVRIVGKEGSGFKSQVETTDSTGVFCFENLEEGECNLTFIKDGYFEKLEQLMVKVGKTSNVEVELVQVQPKLTLSALQLNFGKEESLLSVFISNTGNDILRWSVSHELSWLFVEPSSGETTNEKDSILVSIDRSTLPNDIVSDSILLKSNGGEAYLTVTFDLATLIVTPQSLSFGENDTINTLNLLIDGVGSVAYEATTEQSWISIENAEGTVSNEEEKTIKVSVSRNGLEAGEHTGKITIKSGEDIIDVAVSMLVPEPQKPTLGSSQVGSIESDRVRITTSILSLGDGNISQHGHCWSTSPNPTVDNDKTELGKAEKVDSYSDEITNLEAVTKYYIRAYATNVVGVSYGEQIEFTTVGDNAVVSTEAATQVGQTTATLNGAVFNDGGVSITKRGFYWATHDNPTEYDNEIVLNGTIGNMVYRLNGLQKNRIYYYRAFATNQIGVSVGDVQSFIANSSAVDIVYVAGGSFMMGSEDGDDDESPIHSVTLSSFNISKHKVTYAQYIDFLNAIGAKVVSATNSTTIWRRTRWYASYKGVDLYTIRTWNAYTYNNAPPPRDIKGPIQHKNGRFYFDGKSDINAVYISYDAAKLFTEWIGGKLPTEAEWEYAARGGVKSKGYQYAGTNNIDNVFGSSNELGIFNMSGNGWEWCNDWYDENYYYISPENNPTGAISGKNRVTRGGIIITPESCRVSNREYPILNNYTFRVVFDVNE